MAPALHVTLELLTRPVHRLVLGLRALLGRHTNPPATEARTPATEPATASGAFAEPAHADADLQALLDSIAVGVLMVARHDRTVLFYNRGFQDMTGVSLEIGKPLDGDWWLERPDGGRIATEEASISRVMKTGAPITLSDPVLITTDGRRVPLRITSAPVRRSKDSEFDAVVTVIQDRREIEQAVSELRAWESRFERVTRLTGQAIYDWALDGDRCRFSGALESVFGWKASDVDSNEKWNAITHPEDLPSARSEYDNSLREGRAFDQVYRVVHADGRWLWVRDRGEHLFDGEGKAIGMVGTIADITQQREIEAQLRQSQKMETIGTLAGGIAHDFNNHLTAVIGHLSLLEERNSPAADREPQIRLALRAAERCAELTRGLLAFSRLLPAKPRPVFINAVVTEASRLLQHMLPASIELLVDLDRSEPMTLADPIQIEQVLFNLCTNARDAMDEAGTLRIATRITTRPRATAAAPNATGEWIEIEVSDTGTGIAPEVLPRIFEPFFSTKPVGRGSGLGLTVVYGIVSRHHGLVEVESAPDRGTVFRILMPRFTAPAGQEPPAAAPLETRVSLAGRTILVVDDEQSVREYATEVLRGSGCGALCAADGDAGLALLAEDPELVHAVLLDLTMPGTPVPLIIASMRRLVPGLPIVLTSGFVKDAGAREAIPNLPFLQKPYLPHDLRRMLEQVLADAPAVSSSR